MKEIIIRKGKTENKDPLYECLKIIFPEVGMETKPADNLEDSWANTVEHFSRHYIGDNHVRW